MTKAKLKVLLKTLIKSGDETDKVELKSSFDFAIKKDRIRLVKCIAAIANTDSPFLDNSGYIILGAKRGHLVGGFNSLEQDSTSANIHAWVTNYIEPEIAFSVHRFHDKTVGWWGVIIIPPSIETHQIKQEYREDKLNIRKGDIYVRHGDLITLADSSDINRLQTRRFKNTFDKFESEMGVLRREIAEMKSLKPDLKLYFLDERNNQHESLEVQPVIWERTKEELEGEALNNARIVELEKQLAGLKHGLMTTYNAKKFSTASEKLREELSKRKTLRYEYQQNAPVNSRIIELKFMLFNNGSMAASGISLYVIFPVSLDLSATRRSFQGDVENPSLEGIMKIFPNILSTSSNLSPMYPASAPAPDFVNPKSGGPDFTKNENENRVKYWMEKLLQGHSYVFDPIYFISPDNDLDMPISYSIYAENSPGAVQASLQLSLRPRRKDLEKRT